MKLISTFFFSGLLLATLSIQAQTTTTILNDGFNYVPAEVTVTVGDTVKFVLGEFHNVREVSQTSWNANDTISNGGFSTGFGGGTFVATTSGTFYYVCVPHASFGMKGTLIVTPASNIDISLASQFSVKVAPQPVVGNGHLMVLSPMTTVASFELSDLAGNQVLVQKASLVAGANEIEIAMEHLPAGIYLLSAVISGTILAPTRLVKIQ